MRIYGTSPLYNYVELVFRCKKLFILAIIVGCVITSTMVYMRKTMYKASFVAQLTGDTDPSLDARPNNPLEQTPAMRKAQRIVYWVMEDADFMPGVLKAAGIDRNYPEDQFNQVLKRARESVDMPPRMINGMLMKVTMSWPNEKELEGMLNQMYSAFARKTVDLETLSATNHTEMLKAEYEKFNKEADEKAKKRVEYLTRNYYLQPTYLGTSMGLYDRALNNLAEAERDLSETRSRISVIDSNLASTPKFLDEKTITHQVTDPTIALGLRINDRTEEMNHLLERYNPSHPSVKAIQSEIDNLKRQFDSLKNKTPEPDSSMSSVKQMRNPTYEELAKSKASNEINITGLQRRIASLKSEVAKQEQFQRGMPAAEVESDRIEREFKLASTYRNQSQAALMAARVTEERDKFIQARSIALGVKPKAESMNSGGKTMLLYALGPLLGIIVAFGFSLLLESLDHTLRTPVEVEKYLGKPVLAVIPKMHAPSEGRKKLASAAKPSITS